MSVLCLDYPVSILYKLKWMLSILDILPHSFFFLNQILYNRDPLVTENIVF